MEQPQFSREFIKELQDLFIWRRDVRHFKRTPVPQHILQKLLELACLSPSVGLSEPWRFVKVDNPRMRKDVRDNFEETHHQELSGLKGEDAKLYATLKLAGLDEAPHHIAIFCETDTAQGKGLGRSTMPQTTTWSAIIAIHTFWLAATAYGIGTGWVSIVDPQTITRILRMPPHWQFLGYLCVGYPQTYERSPELQRKGWEKRNPHRRRWIIR